MTRRGWSGVGAASNPAAGLVALIGQVDAAKRAGLVAMAVAGVREAKIELSKPGTGRIYRRATFKRDGTRSVTPSGKKRFGTHQASAPGHPPAVDTGQLRNSVGWEVEDARGSVRVGTNVKHGEILELEKDRPWLSTSIERVQRLLGRTLIGVLRAKGTR